MTAPLDRRQIFQIFDAALDVDPDSRAAFLQQRCGSDTALRDEVEKLIASATGDQHLTGLLTSGPPSPQRLLTGREYGHFRLLELIGEGGMGIVYRAERLDGVPQAVAIKILRGELNDAQSARFEGEALMLAQLEHPAIARLIDVGVQDGEAWLAMELVRGQPIDEYCERHALPVRARVQLLALIADAIVAAHRVLVVHRDIKPTNVLVTDDGAPKLIDFGISKRLNAQSTEREMTTDVRRLFTPNYAAPEQVAGEPVTVATDVFGLGALGFRLLTGCAPFADTSSAVGYMMAVTQRDLDPSSVVAATRSGLGPAVARALRGDLDAILLKALARDPARRYASAQDLKHDLQRYLDGEPVLARLPTMLYRGGKFVRRNALAVSLSFALALGAITAASIFAVQTLRVAQANSLAAKRGEFLQNVLKSANPRNGQRDITVAEVLDEAAHTLGTASPDDPIVTASMYALLAETNDGLGRYPSSLESSARALSLLTANHGKPTELAEVLITRANALRESDDLKESEAALRQALRLLGNDNATRELRAQAYDTLAIGLKHESREPEAEAAYRSSIALYRLLTGKARAPIALPLSNLSVLLGEEGRNDESRQLAFEALEQLRSAVPRNELDVLSAEANYAGALVNDSQFMLAEPSLRHVAQQRAKLLGAQHRDTLLAQANQADVLNELGRYAEAATLAHTTASGLERVSGPDDALTLYALHIYGTAACQTPQADDGLVALQRVASERAKRYGTTDWHVASTQVSIGTCLVALKRYREAEPLLVSAIAVLERTRGRQFYRTQAGLRALEKMRLDFGKQK